MAIASYGLFKELREAGAIPAGLRFQVGLPFPSRAMNAFKHGFAADYPRAAAGYEDLVARELGRLFGHHLCYGTFRLLAASCG